MNTSEYCITLVSLLISGFQSHNFWTRLVEETLAPLDPDRRAYRLVGGILVERTVKEVLPSVTSNRENVSKQQGLDGNLFARMLSYIRFVSFRKSWTRWSVHCKSD